MHWSTVEKQSLAARYQAGESVAEICTDTGIARSTFYAWIRPYTTTTTDSGHMVSQQEFIKMKQRIQKPEQKVEILQKVGYTASATLQEKLQELSKLYGQYSVHVLRKALCVSRGIFYNHIFQKKEMGLSSIRSTAKQGYKKLHKPGKKRNILRQQFQADRPNQIWVSDVTCFKLGELYLYTCVILDLFSRKIIA